jgi:hypothetical protein
MENTVFF